jgi:hypothetical protein
MVTMERGRVMMDVNYYCDAMNAELTAIRSRLYGMIREMMEMSDDNKLLVSPQITELNSLTDDLTRKLDALKRECPADWNPQREDIEDTRQELREKINMWDAEHIAYGYLP